MFNLFFVLLIFHTDKGVTLLSQVLSPISFGAEKKMALIGIVVALATVQR
jgi:hypothetical protein